MGALSPTHWLIIIGVVVVLFGAKKLPDAARSMGQSLRILKAETGELRGKDGKDGSADAPKDAAAPQSAAPAVTASPVTEQQAQPAEQVTKPTS
jgi:sec-independent protein translocase protein TatA